MQSPERSSDPNLGPTGFRPGTGARVQRLAAVLAAALLLAFVIAFFARSRSERVLARETLTSAAALPIVDVTTVHGASADGHLTLPGETAAWYESTIYARVNGYVSKWLVDIGDHVSKGQTMALIDTPELDAELVAAKAKLEAANADVKVKQAASEFAASTYARWRDSPRGVVSEQEREDKKAADTSAAAQLDAARAQVALAQADVDRLSAFEQFKRVTAPYDGAVTQRNIDIGNLVTAGSASNTTPLYRVAQDDPIRVFVDVPQSAAAQLMKTGVPATISGSGINGKPLEGHISRTSDAIDPRARTFRAEVDLPNPSRQLVPGLYVQVAFQLQNDGFYQIPAAALSFRSDGPTAAVVQSDGTVAIRHVVIARDDGDTVELSSGVRDGEQLILNLNSQIVAGEKVLINHPDVAHAVAMRSP